MAASPSFAQAVLKAGGFPVTPQNVAYLNTWHQYEQSPDANNPFNTTLAVGGSHGTNSAGVQSYADPQVGIHATVATIKNGFYPNIVKGLASGNPAPYYSAIATHDLPKWGSHSFANYLLQQSGGLPPVAPTNLSTSAPSIAPQASPALPSSSLTLTTKQPTSPLADPVVQQILTSNDQRIGIAPIPFASLPQLKPSVAAAITTAPPVQQPKIQQISKHTTVGSTGQLTYKIQGHETKTIQNALSLAEDYIGTPYSYGGGGASGPSYGIEQGANTKGFDCSGLLQYMWARAGVSIPRTSYDQFKNGTPIQKSQLQPGDGVFFTGSDPQNGLPGHVAIYIGNGKVLVAPHTGADVEITALNSIPGYQGARRYA